LAQRVLLDDVLCHGEKIGLGRADRLDVRDAEHAQVDFLDDIRQVGYIADADHKERPELITVRCREICYQRLSIVRSQSRTPD
jgi:hypothetical protein